MFCLERMKGAARVATMAGVLGGLFGVPLAHASDSPAPTALPAGAVAVVNGVAIPTSLLDDAVRRVSANGAQQPDTPQLRQMLTSGLIAREVLRQGAEQAHYDQKPEVKQAPAQAKIDTEVRLYLADHVHPDAVTDAQVRSRYDALVASLGKDEFKARIITVGDEATARKVLAQVKAGEPFDALAKAYSVAATGAQGGEMPWMSFPVPAAEGKTQGLPLPIARTIAQLPAGGITPQPVQIGNAWVIVKLDAKRPTQIPPFEQVKDTVKAQLEVLALQKAAAAFTAAQIRGATIQQ